MLGVLERAARLPRGRPDHGDVNVRTSQGEARIKGKIMQFGLQRCRLPSYIRIILSVFIEGMDNFGE